MWTSFNSRLLMSRVGDVDVIQQETVDVEGWGGGVIQQETDVGGWGGDVDVIQQ